MLLACADEGTHMINRMVFEMMRAAGVENVQESCWVDVFLNGEYAGNYLLTQKVELAEKEENGNWRNLMDEESVSSKYLLDEISKCPDGFNGSNYCYLKNGKLYFGAPWDYEFAFGNQPAGYAALELPDGLYHQLETSWYRKLSEDEKFMEKVRKKYEDFFRPYLQKVLPEQLSSWAEEIEASMGMDIVRWGQPEGSFRQKIEDVKKFAADRLSWLDKEWLGVGNGETGTYHKLTLMNGDEIEQIYYIRDGSYAEEKMLERDDAHFEGWYEDAECTQKADILSEPVHDNIVLYSKFSAEAARMELVIGMIPLGILVSVLAVWIVYSLKNQGY